MASFSLLHTLQNALTVRAFCRQPNPSFISSLSRGGNSSNSCGGGGFQIWPPFKFKHLQLPFPPMHDNPVRPLLLAEAGKESLGSWLKEGVKSSKQEDGVDEELQKLLRLVPQRFRKELEKHPHLRHLVEIVMDLGRRPTARFPLGDWPISEELITSSDLDNAVSLVGEFTDDNRTGINRTLHRISAIRNRAGCVIGLTCRVGRAISGSAEMVRDLVSSGGSLLLMGPPGVGKTTAIREIARMLANEYDRRVVIVDTSNEIGGDGDVPHPGIGRARRMQVVNVDLQHKVMIEAVENHMPQTIVVDEIGTELEALAAVTIAQRGVQLVGTAHGMTVENLMKNPSLEILVGCIQSVTLGDEEARRRGVQKSVLERKGPSTFATAVEMISRTKWRVHKNLEATVDALLAGRQPFFEVRAINDEGDVVIGPTPSSSTQILHSFVDQVSCLDSYNGEECIDSEEGDELVGHRRPWKKGDPSLLIYNFQISEDLLEQVLEVMELERAINLTNDIGMADAILALRSELKQNSWVKNMAKLRQLPIFAIKANTMAQIVRALKTILGFESLTATSLYSISQKNDESDPIVQKKRPTLEEEIDALEEVRLAIETIVIPKGQPVELLPRSSEIISLQSKMIQSYQLTSEQSGIEAETRLRILPFSIQDQWKTARMVEQPQGKQPIDDDAYNKGSANKVVEGGTSISRLPILPN